MHLRGFLQDARHTLWENGVAVASYGNRIRVKYTLKWGIQIMGSYFGASSEEYSKKEGEST